MERYPSPLNGVLYHIKGMGDILRVFLNSLKPVPLTQVPIATVPLPPRPPPPQKKKPSWRLGSGVGGKESSPNQRVYYFHRFKQTFWMSRHTCGHMHIIPKQFNSKADLKKYLLLVMLYNHYKGEMLLKLN